MPIILRKLWRSIKAHTNKIVNVIWIADPIAKMQYEYDLAVTELKDGREGLQQHRALVERMSRHVTTAHHHLASLDAKVKAYL